MRTTLTIVRAISVVFVRRAVKPLVIVGAVVLLASATLGAWLTTQSAWWWLLEFVFICSAIVFAAVATLFRMVVQFADPPQSADQRAAVVAYADKMQRVAERMQLSQFMLLFQVVRDVLRPRTPTFIEELSRDNKTLVGDFTKLQVQFSKRDFEDV